MRFTQTIRHDMFHAPTTFFALGKVPGGVQTAVFECPLSEYEEFKQSFYYELVVARTSSVELVAGVDGVLHGVPVWEVFPDIAPERVDLPDVLSDDTLHDGRALAPCIGHCADTCAHYTASPCAFLTTSSTRMCLAWVLGTGSLKAIVATLRDRALASTCSVSGACGE